MRDAVVVAVMVLILLALTLWPRVRAYLARRARAAERFVVSQPEPSAAQLATDALGQAPDAADATDDEVTLYAGGAASPAVVLHKRVLQIPLSVSHVDAGAVQFHGAGGFEVVAAGAMAHADFALAPLSGAELILAKARAPDAVRATAPRGALVRQRYIGYYNDQVGFFAAATPSGPASLVSRVELPTDAPVGAWSCAWSGVVRPERSGLHDFWVRSAGASHVVVDGVVVVDNGGAHGEREAVGSFDMSADRAYAFSVYFGHGAGSSPMMALRWKRAGVDWSHDLGPMLTLDATERSGSTPTAQAAGTEAAMSNGRVRFAPVGPHAVPALAARRDIVGRASRCFGLALAQPARVIAAHDVSSASTPVVPEICKVAALQAVSLSFRARAAEAASVSVFVLPRRAGVPPVSLHAAFAGTDLVLTYLLQADAVGAGPARVAQLAGEQADRDTVTLPGARSGAADVVVCAEVVRGRVRVVTHELNRDRAFLLQAPTFLRDDEPLRTDALDPPALMVASRAADALVVVPFCVGDLRALAGW